jgi:hypothetical protein
VGFGEVGGNWGGATGPGSALRDDETIGEAMSQLRAALSIQVTLRIPLSVSAGTTWAGVQAQATFRDILIQAYLYAITPNDQMRPGGFYELGDIILGVEKQGIPTDASLLGEQAETNREGYRVIYGGLEYRVRDDSVVHPFGNIHGIVHLHCRKIGNP